MKSKNTIRASIVALLLLAVAGPAWAQSSSTATTSFQVQRFRPSPDPWGVWNTESGETLKAGNFLVGVFVNYAKDPLVLQKDGKITHRIISRQVGLDLLGSFGITSWLEVGVAVPFTPYMEGELPNVIELPADDRRRVLGNVVMGDPRIRLKFGILSGVKHGVDLAVILGGAIPVGGKSNFGGGDGLTMWLEAAATLDLRVVRLSGNVGYRLQPAASFLNLEVDDELIYRAGVTVPVVWLPGDYRRTPMVEIGAELEGGFVVAGSAAQGSNRVPVDFLLGLKVRPGANIHLSAGAGFGTEGYGSPLFRIFFGLLYSPYKKVLPDSDGDGLVDPRDRCPKESGPKENRGCPWPDTDKDGVLDKDDKCPKVPGPKANAGCPWPDTDRDGVLDKDDRCPKVPGPKTNRGCPWGDKDGDGVKDNVDRCPTKKGAKGNAGCPWPDADDDGVPDKDDKCPTLPGPKSSRGCPPKPKVKVIVKKRKIVILQKVFFEFNKATIRPVSYPILNEVAANLKYYRHIRLVRVEGHTDNVGSLKYNLKLSMARAQEVRAYLIRKGVSPTRLTAVGYGFTRPLVTGASANTPVGRARNRRVEFRILQQ